jgi:hypothetical protein
MQLHLNLVLKKFLAFLWIFEKFVDRIAKFFAKTFNVNPIAKDEEQE